MADLTDDQKIDSSQRVASDTYDRGIIPAEVAARRKREGESYKKLPQEEDFYNASTDDQTNPDSIRTTDGYTVDREGLLNNYAVEPEMYYEVPGDARDSINEDNALRYEELQEAKEDKTGKLTESSDTRGKGPGLV